MPTGNTARRRLLPLLFLFLPGVRSVAQPAADAVGRLTPAQAQSLIDRALANELAAAQDQTHPMRYLLRKTSPRLTSAKEIIETRDGEVARLVSINDQPLSAADQQKEQARLEALAADPGLQRHRNQSQDADTRRALKVLRVLPQAFLYQDHGKSTTPAGIIEKFTYKPNPAFTPPDLESQVLTVMTGELWVDPAQERVVHLDGSLVQDVDFGWGILGRLNKGGWIVIDQTDIGANQWRTAHFQMKLTGRVLLKTRVFDTVETETAFAPVPEGIPYSQGIKLLLEETPGGAVKNSP